MAAVASAERKWTEAGIPLTTRLLEWVVSASTLELLQEVERPELAAVPNHAFPPTL
jgi:hypothetical protein